MKNPFQWEHPKAFAYNDTIRKRIIGYEYLFTLMADDICTHMSDAAQVIVVGAGGGQELSTLMPLLRAAHFVAIDPSDNMLALAKHRLMTENIAGEVTYITGELADYECVADIVTCHLVLHFLQEPTQKAQLLKQIAQHVKIGGYVYLSSINGDIDDPIFKQQLDAWGRFAIRNGVKPHQWEAFAQSFGDTLMPITTEALYDLCEAAGLRVAQQYFRAYGIEAYRLERVR